MPARPFGLLLMLAGCQGEMSRFRQDCATWEELVLTDPAGEAPADVFVAVRAAIDQFAAWSAREGLCVEEVRLVEEIEHLEIDPVGYFYGPLIEVEYRAYDLERVVFHELCHAADAEAGSVSEARPEWFGAQQPREGFAGVCEEGPRPISQLEAIEDACGEDLLAGRQRWINDEVFGAAEVPSEPPAGVVSVNVERRALGGLPGDLRWEAHAGGKAVYLLRDGDDGAVDVVQVDVATGLFRAIDGPELHDGQGVALFSSGEGPLLVAERASRAWRVVEAVGVLVEVPFAPFDHVAGGAVLGGAAWVVGTALGEEDAAFWRVDLATGARERLALPDGVRSWSPAPDGALLAGRAESASGSRWLVYDPAADSWSEPGSPAGWTWSQRVTLPDGRMLATWLDLVSARAGFGAVSVLDPESGAWWLAEAPCADDAVGRSHQLLSVGGVPYLWEYPNGWDASRVEGIEGHAVTRIEVRP